MLIVYAIHIFIHVLLNTGLYDAERKEYLIIKKIKLCDFCFLCRRVNLGMSGVNVLWVIDSIDGPIKSWGFQLMGRAIWSPTPSGLHWKEAGICFCIWCYIVTLNKQGFCWEAELKKGRVISHDDKDSLCSFLGTRRKKWWLHNWEEKLPRTPVKTASAKTLKRGNKIKKGETLQHWDRCVNKQEVGHISSWSLHRKLQNAVMHRSILFRGILESCCMLGFGTLAQNLTRTVAIWLNLIFLYS